MSLVADQVRRLDAQVERISLIPLASASVDAVAVSGNPGHEHAFETLSNALSSPRFNELLHLVKALSPTSTSGALLTSQEVKHLLVQSGLIKDAQNSLVQEKSPLETEVEWLLVSKATVQTYGLILNTLLDQIIPLSDDIWYWDEVLGSYVFSSLYTVQTAPLRIWAMTRDVYRESRIRFQRLRQHLPETVHPDHAEAGSEHVDERSWDAQASADAPAPTLSQQWLQFYSIVRDSVVERSITDLQKRILSPVALCRAQARRQQARLKRLREMSAAGLGILLDEGLDFGSEEAGISNTQEWKGLVERSVALMDMVLRNVLVIDIGLPDFEDKVFAGVEEDPELSIHVEDTNLTERPKVIASRLLELLEVSLPGHVQQMRRITKENGRPNRLIRYWLPTVALLASSSTILRLLVNRRNDIIGWVSDFGATARDFWFNWVIDPICKIVGTIRHDANSEIALMSRDSLKADRESLERMVLDFALDKPELASGSSGLTDSQLAEIRARVKEGDVTPVLRAYERDLRKPFVGAVRGDLVRSLLIQIQKTKVDLEVAISGIDALLKSQELVFGFVGLTPGILVSIGFLQYLRNVLGGRKGIRRSQRARRGIRVLRRIDRILSEATPTQNNLISYKDHGLLVCEVHVLRQLGHGLLPGDIEREFIEDLDELANVKGIQVQLRALERIRWAYAEWLVKIR